MVERRRAARRSAAVRRRRRLAATASGVAVIALLAAAVLVFLARDNSSSTRTAQVAHKQSATPSHRLTLSPSAPSTSSAPPASTSSSSARSSSLPPSPSPSPSASQTEPSGPRDPATQHAVDDAVSYAKDRGYHVGVAVLDRKTGQIYSDGHSHGKFATESVVKVFIATRLLLDGEMHGETSQRAFKMITQSDDDIASAFYGEVGGDNLEPWIERHYDLPDLGAATPRPGWWGSSRITPVGMVQFYAKAAADPKVGPWLLRAMHHAHKYGSDGTDQSFGLPSATSNPAVKQGWGCNLGDTCAEADVNSTGFVGDDRYAVALLARGPLSTYLSQISATLTGMAEQLLPHGQIP